MANEASGRATTGHEIARRLGISASTVSRAFSDSASISPKMREKIMRLARELGYAPNAIARSQTTQRTNLIGIVMPNSQNPFYSEVLDLLVRDASLAGLQALLLSVPPGEEVDSVLPLMLQYQLDAAVITNAAISSTMAQVCFERGIDVVLFNRYIPGLKANAVVCDNADGSRQIAEHFLAHGRKRPAFVAGRADATTNIDRERGFVTALTAHGMPLFAKEDGNYTYEGARAATQRLFRSGPGPDCIFFANDLMAVVGMDVIRRELGKRIPEDVMVAGFDDIRMSSWAGYDLTTVRQPAREMVQQTLALLKAPEDSRKMARTVILPGTLVIRGSTGGTR